MSMAATTPELRAAASALSRRYLLDYPSEAARTIERMPVAAVAELVASQPAFVLVRVWESLAVDVAAALLDALPPPLSSELLTEATPSASAAALAQLEDARRAELLTAVRAEVATDLRSLVEYPDHVAGRLMDPRVTPLRADITVGQALTRLKIVKRRGLRELFVVDDEARLVGRVEIQDLAVSDESAPLRDLMRPLLTVANDLDPREEFVDRLQQKPITELPVVNVDGRFVGVIRQAALLAAVEQETSLDVQAMVGVSRDERALSPPGFAVASRLPWLQINLLTAFLAAAVVGLFEGTIAKFTALAVLLPVVAGQSGNCRRAGTRGDDARARAARGHAAALAAHRRQGGRRRARQRRGRGARPPASASTSGAVPSGWCSCACWRW